MKLEPKKFTGIIQVGDDTYPATFEVKTNDGRIQVEMEPIATKAALLLHEGQPGMRMHEFTLSGSNDSGDATKYRNAIAHPNEGSKKEDFWPTILLVRELVSQIMFHEIGYTGPYESYVGGYKTVYPK